MKVKVLVTPKAAVLDPQGAAVRDAMQHLGMPEVHSVRIGKYLEIEVDDKTPNLDARLNDLCRDLLSNPVIEDYELQKAEGGKHKKTPNVQRPTSNVQPKKGKKKPPRLRSPRRPTARQARKGL